MPEYRDIWYQSLDGLRLYARDYPNPEARLTLLCLHGLTRNSADFEPVVAYLQRQYRLVVPDQRGRGRSDYDSNPLNYHPGTYVADMAVLLELLGIESPVCIGTSMGGLMAMIMATTMPGRVQAVVLNDIGPEIDPAGIERLRTYVGKTAKAKNWSEAVARTRGINGPAFPDFRERDWRAFSKRLYRENAEGVPVLCYDPAISVPMEKGPEVVAPPNFWPAFTGLIPLPAMVIRGELSDILSADAVRRMVQIKPDLVTVSVPRRGHAPLLDEPVARSAIIEFLQALA